MSLKYVGETALAENIAQEKIYIEGIRAALDAAKQDVIQVTTLGTATADKVGIAYQYMGADTSTLKHGWFYEVVEVTPATDPATYKWQEFEFGGGLPYSDTAPSNPSGGDVFLYTGAETLEYKKGGIYQYNAGTLFYGWDKQSPYMTAYTLSEIPSVNDAIYSSSGQAWGDYVVSYDAVNNAIEDDSGNIYTRNNSIDVVIGAGWSLISRYNIGDGLEVNTQTNTLSAKIATTHTLGMAKGGRGTMIGDYGEVNVFGYLKEGSVDDPGSSVSIAYYDSGFRLSSIDNGNYKKGGIYQLQINAVTPVGTENPSEEGWYEYTGTYGDDNEYELSEDTTVDSEKTYYTIAWKLVSANPQEFNTNDFDEVNDTVSLDVTQRTFTGTQAEWDALTTAEKKTYGTVNITDDSDSTPEYYSTAETKTNKVWIDGKPIYRRVFTGLSINLQEAWVSLGISTTDIDTLVSYTALANDSNTNYYDGIAGTLTLMRNGQQLYCFSRNGGVLKTLILEYTKTTD